MRHIPQHAQNGLKNEGVSQKQRLLQKPFYATEHISIQELISESPNLKVPLSGV